MNKHVLAISTFSLIAFSACKPSGGSSAGNANSVGGAACAGAKFDLSKISGDWIVSSPIDQPEGRYPGSQYRIRFDGPPAADGTVKAHLAFRMDTRPYTGKYVSTALGGSISLLEDMSDATVASLRGNKDPHQPMRSAVNLSPDEVGCVLDASDETITYLGDKDLRNTLLGPLKLVPAPAGAQYSFVRCTAPKSVYFDGKADEGGSPVHLTPGKAVMAKVTREKKDLPACPYSADVFVDGVQVASKVAGTVGMVAAEATPPPPPPKGKKAAEPAKPESVEAVTWQNPVTVQAGPPHGVEFQTWADCTDGRKLIASACNLALTQ
jgi:hypothetical protein